MTALLSSMTGFACSEGVIEGAAWSWEIRSVNGRGLELRLKLPSGYDRLEPALRDAASKHVRRGNVQANLTLRREDQVRLAADPQALEQALALALQLHARIPGSPTPRAEALLALPGVLRPVAPAEAEGRSPSLDGALVAGFDEALARLVAARRAEGARLSEILADLLRTIAALCVQAASQAADQPVAQRARLLENLHGLLREAPPLPEERIAQEVALLASRSDVREELDRLDSHVQAAHALMAEGAGVGRRFDFLVQEFNREANTLCSKSASAELTATGLRLKAAIEQLREQVQKHRMILKRRGVCLVIAAPSGAGKSSITGALLSLEPNLMLSVSATTRPPRPAERHGVDYFFYDQAEFNSLAQSGELLEWATVFGRSYGTPRGQVEDALACGRDIAFDIDWQGHRNLRTALPGDVVSVFILPPSLEALEARLRARGSDTPAEIASRMAAAREEIAHWHEFDHVIVNASFEEAVASVRAVLRSARLSTRRQLNLAGFVAALVE